MQWYSKEVFSLIRKENFYEYKGKYWGEEKEGNVVGVNTGGKRREKRKEDR